MTVLSLIQGIQVGRRLDFHSSVSASVCVCTKNLIKFAYTKMLGQRLARKNRQAHSPFSICQRERQRQRSSLPRKLCANSGFGSRAQRQQQDQELLRAPSTMWPRGAGRVWIGWDWIGAERSKQTQSQFPERQHCCTLQQQQQQL